MRITGNSSYLHDYSNLVSMIDSDNVRIICQVVPILVRWVPSLFLVDEVRRSLLHCLETREEMQLEVRRRTIGLNNPKKKKVLLCLAIKHRVFAMKKLGVKIGGFSLTMQNRGLACIAYKH